MARPVQGGSPNTWGTELNDWLDISHAIDGTLKLPMTLGSDPGIGTALWNASDNRTGSVLDVAGSGTPASANEAAVTIQATVPSTSSGASYEKIGLFVRTRTSDPSSATTRDMVGIDTRGEIASTNATGRAWGLYSEGAIVSGGTGDGLLYAAEFQTNNGGTDVSTVGGTLSKYGLHVVAVGSNPSTAALYLNASGSGLWHKGLYADPSKLGSGASDTFLELAGKLSVNSQSGKMLIGSTTVQIAASMLEVKATAGTSTGTVNFWGANSTDSFTMRLGNSAGSSDFFVAGGAGAYLTGTAAGDVGVRVLTSGKMFHLGGNAVKLVTTTFDDKLGFYAATPVAKPTVTGSRAANAALASALTALANLGLITDSSSA